MKNVIVLSAYKFEKQRKLEQKVDTTVKIHGELTSQDKEVLSHYIPEFKEKPNVYLPLKEVIKLNKEAEERVKKLKNEANQQVKKDLKRGVKWIKNINLLKLST